MKGTEDVRSLSISPGSSLYPNTIVNNQTCLSIKNKKVLKKTLIHLKVKKTIG